MKKSETNPNPKHKSFQKFPPLMWPITYTTQLKKLFFFSGERVKIKNNKIMCAHPLIIGDVAAFRMNQTH